MKDNDKKIKLPTEAEIGNTPLSSLGDHRINNLGTINSVGNEIKVSTFKNNDLVFPRDELNSNSRPYLRAFEALKAENAYIMGPEMAVTTNPLEEGGSYVGRALSVMPTTFSSYSATGPITLKQPTREEIEELIKKETSSLKRETMTSEQVLDLIEKSNTERQKKQEETMSMVEKQSFEIIRKMFLEGKVFVWRCKCGEILDQFKNQEDIKRIESYLEDFKKGNLKICQRKGSKNWFELRGGEIIWSVSVLLDKELKPLKEDEEKMDNL